VSGNVGWCLGRDPRGGDLDRCGHGGQLLRRRDGHNEPVQVFRFGRFDSGEPVDVLVQRRDEPNSSSSGGCSTTGRRATGCTGRGRNVLRRTRCPGGDLRPAGLWPLRPATRPSSLGRRRRRGCPRRPPAAGDLRGMGVSGGGPHTLACTYALPRAARGRRHPLVAILAMAAAAVLAGARSMTTIAEWAADAPQPVRTRARCPPPRPQPPRRPRPRPPPPDPGAPGPAAWPAPSAPGWPIVTALGSHRGGHGRWPWTARPYAVPATKQTVARSTCWPDGPHQPRGAGPTPARRRPRRGLRRAAAAGRARLGRCGGHRRRAADPPAGRLGSWSPTSRPTTCWSSRPTSRPCWAAASACPGSACPWGTAPVTAATAASSCAPSRR
jgi:DDE_Tnp_1-associated